MNALSWSDFLLRLGAAVLAGALIGFERQRRSRGAGLRTNTLVAAGAAMFVLIAQMSAHGSGVDPTRITSYVVSGVGFLGAGVIISDGVSVRGINTAATVWCSCAVGVLAGFGLLLWATIVASLVLLANAVFHEVERRVRD